MPNKPYLLCYHTYDPTGLSRFPDPTSTLPPRIGEMAATDTPDSIKAKRTETTQA
ncbi:MAG: hypothetical protein ABI169_08445 [Chitinophagaceae bacterium]